MARRDLRSASSRAPDRCAATAERIALLSGWVRVALEGERLSWFDATLEGLRAGGGQRELVRAVGLAPRKLGKNDLALSTDDLDGAERARPGFDPGGLTVDQAARIAFLLAAAERDEASFPHSLADLYRTAELAESIAYLRGLPLFPGSPRPSDRRFGRCALGREAGLRGGRAP